MTAETKQEPQPALRSIRGVHCWKCYRLFIEELTAPYRYTCRHKGCNAVNEEK